jgi:hypothetical protein
VNVAEVDAVLDRVEADFVRCADNLTALDAASSRPDGEAEIVVVAAFAALGFGGAWEFSTPENEIRIEESAAFEVPDKCSDGPVGLREARRIATRPSGPVRRGDFALRIGGTELRSGKIGCWRMSPLCPR